MTFHLVCGSKSVAFLPGFRCRRGCEAGVGDWGARGNGRRHRPPRHPRPSGGGAGRAARSGAERCALAAGSAGGRGGRQPAEGAQVVGGRVSAVLGGGGAAGAGGGGAERGGGRGSAGQPGAGVAAGAGGRSGPTEGLGWREALLGQAEGLGERPDVVVGETQSLDLGELGVVGESGQDAAELV